MGEVLERNALGDSAYIGALYDGHRRSFMQGSIFNQVPLPAKHLHSLETPYSRCEYTIEDTTRKRFDLLGITADVRVSIFSGLIKISLSGKYINQSRNSSRTVRSSLVQNIRTKEEKVNIYDEGIKDMINQRVLEITSATHFVGGIRWGVNALASFEMRNVDKGDKIKVEGELGSMVKTIIDAVLGSGGGSHSDPIITTSNPNFRVSVSGDTQISGQDISSVEDVVEYMRRLPSRLLSLNGGKGKPLIYELYPISELKKYMENVLSGELQLIKPLNPLDFESTQAADMLFEELSEVKLQLDDLRDDLESRKGDCILAEKKYVVQEFDKGVSVAEAGLKGDLQKSLVEHLKSGENNDSVESLILKYLESSLYSPSKIKKFLQDQRQLVDKMAWYGPLKDHRVNYILNCGEKDQEDLSLRSDSFFVFGFPDFESNKLTDTWRKNYFFFLQLIEENKEDKKVSFMIAEGKGLTVSVRQYKNGSIVSGDLLEETLRQKSSNFIRHGIKMEVTQWKPNKRKDLELRCPLSISGLCGVNTLKWICERCHERVEYDLESKYFCSCGESERENVLYKCSDPRHGSKFEPFKEVENLRRLLAKMSKD